jgi:Domain of unknown function (DUF5667)
MVRFFDRKPDERSTTFAEAQALIDDGLDLDFVLGIFPDDAEWLREELEFSGGLQEAYSFEPPSYFFEASLKSKFLAAARQPRLAPAIAVSPYRTAFASMSVAAGALGVGVLALGFVTAGSAVPGDWNYTFKLANERLQYTLSSGNDRVNVQLKQTEARVQEIHTLSGSGRLSSSDLDRLTSEVRTLTADLSKTQQLDDVQRLRVKAIADQGAAVLDDVKAKQPALQAPASAAAAALGDAAVTALATPTPTATPATSPTATASATGTGTAAATASATSKPEPTATPTAPAPTASATPTAAPSATLTTAPVTSETASPTPTP